MTEQLNAMKQAAYVIEEVSKHIGRYDLPSKPNHLVALLNAEADNLRTAIEAAEEQEPVGEAYLCDKCQTPFDGAWECPSCGHRSATKEPLYTTPPAAQQQWVGLTEKDRKEIERQSVYVDGAIRMTEAKLKEKNT